MRDGLSNKVMRIINLFYSLINFEIQYIGQVVFELLVFSILFLSITKYVPFLKIVILYVNDFQFYVNDIWVIKIKVMRDKQY